MVAGTSRVTTDLAHGGRWTSLRLNGREWLWHRPDAARDMVSPGDAFVDVGGIEECLPTVRGEPDHGEVWSRGWRREGGHDVVRCADFEFRRMIESTSRRVLARYSLTAEPGFRFVWAAHALLELSDRARIDVPDGAEVLLYPEAAPLLGGWPPDAAFVSGTWPDAGGIDLTTLGAADGSAIGATLPGTTEVLVRDGDDRLRLVVSSAAEVPAGTGIWRNLGGFPMTDPYRSIGVEPMLGHVFDLADAGPDQAATIPAAGTLDWTLTITAERDS